MGTQSDAFECYIVNKSLPAGSKGTKIPLLFSPSSISDSLSASFNQQAIPGGSAPVITYSGTGARTVAIDFAVPIDYLPPNTNFKDTEEYLNALRALVYPRYNGTKIEPPACTLHLTNLVIDGVCTQCNINYKTDQGYGEDGALGAEVSITFMEVLSKAISNNEVSGRTTILVDTKVGTYKEATLKNGTTRSTTTTFSWGNFKLRGNSTVNTRFKLIRSNSQSEYNQYIPEYIDEGYVTYSGDYSVVKFYYASGVPLSFTGGNIKGENGTNASAIYKICLNGEAFTQSTKVLQRNYMPELTAKDIWRLQDQGSGTIYMYVIYVPYLGINTYAFDRALIRTLVCIGGI